MFLKSFGLLAPLAGGALWFSGALHSGVYARDVDLPPEQVASALAGTRFDGLDVPGSPYFGLGPPREERTADGFRWTLASGGETFLVMTAHIAPIDGGAKSRISATVETGVLSKPGAVAAEARLPATMEPILAAAIDAEIAERVESDPAAVKAARERELMAAGAVMAARIIANPEAVRADADEVFREAMAAAQENSPPTSSGPARDKHVSFRPGEPMVDVSR
jgi:hypothetical protein